MQNREDSPPSLRLLVVDDEPIVGKRLRQIYAKMGYEVAVFTSPAAALEAMAEEPFEIVVTDLRMEGMDGWEVLRRTRSINPAARVIVISAFGQAETADQALRQGAYDFIAKPFRVDELKQVVFQATEDLLQGAAPETG